ncbi:MAG TPA: hypothetical protein VKZ56_01810 [Membranihabitans sp.]|nr:hypothetical protein [Membranihabitans sp.]
MNKFVGKWKILPDRSKDHKKLQKKADTYTIQQVYPNMMIIHSEWRTEDNRKGFLGYTIHPDGIPRKASGGDWKYVTKIRGQNIMTTSRIEDEQVKALEIREVLDTGELKVTEIEIDESGQQKKNTMYFRKVDSSA